MKSLWLISIGAALALGAVIAQKYKGADEVLKQVAEATGTQNKAVAASKTRDELKAFQQNASNLSADEAAATWLAFYDAYLSLPTDALYQQQGSWNDRLNFDYLVKSLPPSSAWVSLLTTAHERVKTDPKLENQVLRLFMTVLAGSAEERKTALEETGKHIQKLPEARSQQRFDLQRNLNSLQQAVIMRAGSAKDKMALLEEKIAGREPSGRSSNDDRNTPVFIPDLVAIAGEEKARELLLRALKAGVPMTFENEKTQKMTSQLAAENFDAINKANWTLIQDTDDAELFAAMRQKFPNESALPAYKSAEWIYWVSLIIKGQTDEAAELAEKSLTHHDNSTYTEADQLEMLQQKGFGKQVLDFVKDMLSRKPELSLWSLYIQLSAQQSVAPEALVFLETTLKKEDLSEKARKEIQPHYYKALLSANKIDEGVAVIQTLLSDKVRESAEKKNGQAEKAAPTGLLQQFQNLLSGPSVTDEQSSISQEAVREFETLCVQLMRIGHLLKRDDLFNEGLSFIKQGYTNRNAKGKSEFAISHEAVRLLVEKDRGAEAEALLQEVLTDQTRELDAVKKNRWNDVETEETLATLAWVYEKAGRYDDVVRLLDDAPQWQVPDLIYVNISNVKSIQAIAARSLLNTGKRDEAEKVVSYLLQQSPNNDRGYELLFELGGDPAQLEQRLTTLFETDKFQERPLIWKARLQLDQGRLDEAEQTIRAAIAIDPSDGEQGKGDRMRAYAVLADILEKKGDNEQADMMRGAVKAIRLSEDADDWWTAGMLSRAVEMYEKSLLLFADAYCIQSRLALRYSELGDFEKAEIHYRRAYELMPDSFGRIESHCFGCEGAFRGKRAQNIAEKVFTKLAEEQPDKAQVFYLLGYLRSSQHRYDDAAEYYRKAVKLDPDYLNAWNKLGGLAGKVSLGNEERDDITLQLFRLDPRGRHSSRSFDHMLNFRKLWDAVLTASTIIEDRAPTTHLYQLKASREDLLRRDPDIDLANRFTVYSSDRDLRQVFTSHQLLRMLNQFVEQAIRTRD